jgi:hypothetical protein
MAALTIKNLAARQYADAKQKASDAEEISEELWAKVTADFVGRAELLLQRRPGWIAVHACARHQ